MANYIEHISLYGGLYSPTLPLDFPKELTTTKQMANIEATINNIIDIVNNWTSSANGYTDTNIKEVKKQITDLKTKIENGDYLKNGSIDFDKLNGDLTKLIHGEVLRAILDNIQLVNFGLSEDGYFYAECNDNWKNVTFMTNERGQLVVCVLDDENKTVYETNINDKTIDDLYNIYNNLNDKVTINITDIANLTSAINDISEQVNENKTNIDNNLTSITQIQNDIATNEEIQNIFNE